MMKFIPSWQNICRRFVEKHQKDKVDLFRYNTPPDHTGQLPLYTRSLPVSTVYSHTDTGNVAEQGYPLLQRR